MKKSLLLLSLLASANILSQKAKVEPKVENIEEQIDDSRDKASIRNKGETTEDYIASCGGQLPHVPSHQTPKEKFLHKSRNVKNIKVVRAPRQGRAARRGVVQVRTQA